MWGYLDPLPGREDIRGYRAFYWNKMDAWYEEDEQVFKHPRDPYHRVDVLQSSREVRIEINGQTIAESRRQEDVRMDLLEPTDTSSVCPYKGTASYWRLKSDESGRDVAWAYLDPITECPKIKGLIAFFNERVDGLYVDGEPQEKPQTAWA